MPESTTSTRRLTGIGASLVVAALACVAMTPAAASAEPVKVRFTVAGASNDAVNSGVTATGSFFFDKSLITPGEVLFAANGLHALALDFPWDGTTWTVHNAGVVLLGFDADGTLSRWAWGGFREGFAALDSTVFPDVLMAEPGHNFIYTNARTATPGSRGAFEGKVLSWEVTREAAPVPEPASLTLLCCGLAYIAARRRRGAPDFFLPRPGEAPGRGREYPAQY